VDKPILKYFAPEEFADAYEEFYLDQVLNEKEEA
jgi:starch synthase